MKKIVPVLMLAFMVALSSCGSSEGGEKSGGDGEKGNTENTNTGGTENGGSEKPKPEQPDPNAPPGTVQGAVKHDGKPCEEGSADYKVPPCSGPYANYEVKVHLDDGSEKFVKATKADAKGNFSLSLAPGKYVIYTQDGGNVDDALPNSFTVESGATATLDLVVNTGSE